jgi:hypothetical protein
VRTPKPWILPAQPVSRTALQAMGITDSMIRSRRRTGELITLRPAVFLGATYWPDDPAAQHLIRGHAELVANPDAVLSHQTAAVVWSLPTPGFRDWHDLPISVTLPAAGHSARSRRTVHRVAPLPFSQLQRDAEGYSVTSPARTAVDLAARLALPETLVLLDAAARLSCQGLVPKIRRRDYANRRLIEAAVALLSEATATVRCARLRPMLGLVDPGRESAAESLSAGHFELAGIPRPRYQAELRTHRGTFFADALWDGKLIGECDGAIKYADASAYVREKEREQILRDLGYRIVRWQAKEIMTQPAAVVARVARALGL